MHTLLDEIESVLNARCRNFEGQIRPAYVMTAWDAARILEAVKQLRQSEDTDKADEG
ncbi:MAG: hypothetical protein VW443_00295 [Pseudomonadales bacterium]